MPSKEKAQRSGVKQFARGIKHKGRGTLDFKPPPPVIIPRLQAELEAIRAESAKVGDEVRRKLAARRARVKRLAEEGLARC